MIQEHRIYREKKMNQTAMNNNTQATGREGFAMVTTLLVVLILSVLAVGVAWIASSEKKTSFAESVHVRSVYSADAGGEAAINFLRLSETPPYAQNVGTNLVRSQGSTGLKDSQVFDYRVFHEGYSIKPGWGAEYLDWDFRINSHGTASRLGESGVELLVSRLYRAGY
jgi:hypothetical protein